MTALIQPSKELRHADRHALRTFAQEKFDKKKGSEAERIKPRLADRVDRLPMIVFLLRSLLVIHGTGDDPITME
ncbi:hypothetical protein EWB00_001996 [Schistosoma japonicum]|uniref:Uncharacterized protein n=1 Tax=Schistosoma japonicum TaxID=6182 RepID=A0A4Z2CK01_SCHJA|nr:hypothetical protein EWB00_001996 [Schistosoma japonicum]